MTIFGEDRSKKKKLDALFQLQQAIRDFFLQQGFLETPTPPAVPHPGMEPHLHPFKLRGLDPARDKASSLYLHTSPEFQMKELLSLGYENIFSLGYCFRDEPNSTTHRPQFLMLEWYRAGKSYEQIVEDTQELIYECEAKLRDHRTNGAKGPSSSFTFKTVEEVFLEFAGFSFKEFPDFESFEQHLRQNFPELLPSSGESLQTNGWDWDDLFFLVFLNKIEPQLATYPKLILKEYPASQAALSTLKKKDPTVCERFEVYLQGIEIANCFNELCDLEVQKKRYQKQKEQKERLYGYSFDEPEVLFTALDRGLPTPSAGIALGVERLLMALTDIENPFWDIGLY